MRKLLEQLLEWSLMKLHVMALCVGFALTVGCSKCGGGNEIDPTSATTDDIVGIWNGVVPPDELVDDRTRIVFQFDAASDAEQANPYGIFVERSADGRVTLELAEQGAWIVDDAHIGFDLLDGSEPTANEIFALSTDALTLESGKTTSGRLSYERIPLGCPDPDEREGWSATSRQVMSEKLVESIMGYTDIVVDSVGRPHILAGGSICDGGTPCQGRGLPTTYWTRTTGCYWQAYSFGLPFAQPRLLIDNDDQLHAVARTLDGFFHFTASVDEAFADSWTPVPPPEVLGIQGAILGGANIEAAFDSNGTLWMIEGVLDTQSQPQPTLFRYDGAWTLVGPLLEAPQGLYRGRADLSTDAAGNVHVVVQQTAGVQVFDPTDLTTPTLDVAMPSTEGVGCSWIDVQIEGNEIHVACEIVTRVDLGGLHDIAAGYLVHDGSSWSQVQLGPGRVYELLRRGDGFAVVGDTVWWKEDGSWRAPGPSFIVRREGARDPVGIKRASAAFDAANEILHYAGFTHYAWHDGFDDAKTTVSLSFVGDGAGRITSEDGSVDCATDCEVEVPAGTMLFLTPTGDETSSFDRFDTANGGSAPLPHGDGTFGVWATGERIDLNVNFRLGQSGATAEFPGLGDADVLALNDGGVIAVGGFHAGFAPEGTPLTPMAGQTAPFMVGLNPDLSVKWFVNMDQGDAPAALGADIAADGTMIVALNRNSGLEIASIDSATGAERWSVGLDQVIGTHVEAQVGGGALVSGADGTRFLDASGNVTATVPLMVANGSVRAGPLFAASGALAIAWNSLDVQAFDSTGLSWATKVGGNPGLIGGDGQGGAWVLTDRLDLGTMPTCIEDDGVSALLHFDATGACLFRGVGGLAYSGTFFRDGTLAALLADNGLAIVVQAPGDPVGVRLPAWETDPGGPTDLSWSPDGTSLGFSLLVPDGTFTGIIGTVRYK